MGVRSLEVSQAQHYYQSPSAVCFQVRAAWGSSLICICLGCRLPHDDQLVFFLRADDVTHGIQFVGGIERAGEGGEDLLISFGDMDCDAQVCRLK
jgi:hypothetical protein